MDSRLVPFLLAAMLLGGCSQPPPANVTGNPELPPSQAPQATPANTTETPPAQPPPNPASQPLPPAIPAEKSGDGLLLFGRSVSQGWAEYMGLEWDENGTMSGTYEGYRIRRYEVESPPGIVTSAEPGLDRFGSGAVFFKLCFVDFSQEAGENLAEDEGYVQAMYEETVVRRGRKLIVGNALPQVGADTTPGLKSNHREYNEWLSGFASTHEDVYVLDLYGALSGPDGSLRPEYAASPGDSHLNEAGYEKITPELMKILAQAEG